MLGRALARLLPDAAAFRRAELDLDDPKAVGRAVGPGVDLVLNAAASTKVDLAETDAAHLATNGVSVGLLAERCAAVGARLVHVSTDYVFDGRGTRPYREDDPVSPVNAYGRGKLDGERRALAALPDALVVRTSWVYGPGGTNFVDTILKQVESGKTELKVVADQRGRPTYAPDLARALVRLAERGASGLVHFANAGVTTWHGLAVEALRLSGRGDVTVTPCATSDFPRPAPRPAWSVLDTSRYESLAGEAPRPWPEALADHVAGRG